MSGFGHGQDALPDLGGQAKQPHDLRDPDAADALPPGDVGLVFCLAGGQERLSLEGLAEALNHLGRPGFLGRLGLTARERNGARISSE